MIIHVAGSRSFNNPWIFCSWKKPVDIQVQGVVFPEDDTLILQQGFLQPGKDVRPPVSRTPALELTTRCQGTSPGQLFIAQPTARADKGSSSRAIWP